MKYLLSLCISVVFFTVAASAQDTLQQFVGKYKFGSGSPIPDVDVILQDGNLYMNSAAGSSALKYEKTDLFIIIAFNGTAQFTRNQAGRVAGVHIEAAGYVLDGTKEGELTYSSRLWMNKRYWGRK